jgi:hypothetical protein
MQSQEAPASGEISEGSLGASLYPSPEAGCLERQGASCGTGPQGVAVTVVVPRVRNAI